MRLIDDWKNSWRWLSVQVAALAAIVAGVLTAHPAILLGLIGFIPRGPLQYVAAGAVGLVVFAIPVAARLWKQGGRPDA